MNKDEIIRMAREAGWGFNNSRDSDFLKAQLKFAELVAAAEREACAKLCDGEMDWGMISPPMETAAGNCADLIRARGSDAT